MTNIQISSKKNKSLPRKYVRVVVTKDAADWHRLIERSDGTLEYHIGAGKWSEIKPRTFATFIRKIVQGVKQHKIEHFAVSFSKTSFPIPSHYSSEWAASVLVENMYLAAYEFNKYKTTSNKQDLKTICICCDDLKTLANAFKRGEIVGTYTNLARDIANTTAEDMTPTALGNAAKQAAKNTKVKVKVAGEKELTKLKMGALLAVGQGTKSETKLITLAYYGAKDSKQKPIVFIGKGITYDTGGLNAKPSGSMHDMHMDMSGGSSVIAAVIAAAKLGIAKNIVGIVPAAENAISDSSMRAGDIIKSMSGKTIEVVHTDAEGRMVLADAITYAKRFNPLVILDVATLTGASLVALGQHASALMTKDLRLEKVLRDLGEESGEYVWPLPLWDEYKEYIKSSRADIANIAPNFSR
ncbi:MAG: leucyl aminopeptidase family protein, partial [Candidatus Paceibacterota bacterium]